MTSYYGLGYNGGGGIYNANYGTRSVVHNSTFSGNASAFAGGGIYNQGMLTVDHSTLSGNSAGVAGSNGAGAGIFNWGTLTVESSVLSGNSTSNGGGGIFNYGTVTVDSSTFSDNTAYQGGGILNFGALTVQHSTLSGNSGSQYAGGIFNAGTLVLDTSILSGNSSNSGGGINNWPGSTATVHNSTLSGNSYGGIVNRGTLTVDSSTLSGNSGGNGGGINNEGTLTVLNSTFSGNSAEHGGGINNRENSTLTIDSSTFSGNSDWGYGGGIYSRGTSTLNNTIVAANLHSSGTPYDIDGVVASSSSHNLIGVATNLSGISQGSHGNQVGTAATPINPMLGALQNHGGPTATMALLPGSPAFDAGDSSLIPAGVTTDQRGTGYARIEHGTVDIGAYELIVNRPPTAVAGGPYSVPEGGIVVLDGSGSSDPDQSGATLIYDWDFDGDGQYDDATGISPTFSAAGLDGPTSQSVRLRVTDNAGAVSSVATATINVTNVAPVISTLVGPNAGVQLAWTSFTGVRGQELNFSGSFSDAGTLDTHEVSWKFGDGTVIAFHASTAAGALAPSHVFTAIGTYTVTLTVRDDDQGTTSLSRAIVIGAFELQADPLSPGQTMLVVGGSTGNDTIRIGVEEDHNDADAQFVTVRINEHDEVRQKIRGTHALPVSRVVVYAQAGNDDVKVDDRSTIPAWLYGGDGNDKLKGGAGHDVLLGGAGDDLLSGNAGRDLLIGGTGADRIIGNSGDDVLIAGTTDHDNHAAALFLIMKEWTRTDASFLIRVAHLENGGGWNAGYRLNDTTVHDDHTEDVLTGSDGNDWFLFNRDGDGGVKDKVTDLSAFEALYALDLDWLSN